jgi:hypothetical protein
MKMLANAHRWPPGFVLFRFPTQFVLVTIEDALLHMRALGGVKADIVHPRPPSLDVASWQGVPGEKTANGRIFEWWHGRL